MTNPDRFAIIPLPDGPAPANAIAVGPLSMAMEYLPQSQARDKREQQAADLEARALRTVATRRVDSVIAHEREVKVREDAAQAIMSDAIHRFADDVLELSHRFDQFERRRIADALRELPDQDHPQGLSKAQQDDLEAVIEPSAERDRRELAEVEEAIRSERATRISVRIDWQIARPILCSQDFGGNPRQL
jgi:hypothetical protein